MGKETGAQRAPSIDDGPQSLVSARERRRAEQSLRAHETGLRHAQQMARLAHVVTGPLGEFLAWSETLPAMVGRVPRFPQKPCCGLCCWVNCYAPVVSWR